MLRFHASKAYYTSGRGPTPTAHPAKRSPPLRALTTPVISLLLLLALPSGAQTLPPPEPCDPSLPPCVTSLHVTDEEDLPSAEEVSRDRPDSLGPTEAPAVEPAHPEEEQRGEERTERLPGDLPPAPVVPARGPEGGDPFSDANIYLPEGEFDLKVRRLIKNALFEGQVNYNFVDGDVSTFLRYKYYSRNFTYKLSVFDELEFDQLGGNTNEFDRVRGALLLFTYPENFNRRYTLLAQVDSLAFGDLTRPDNDKTNNYLKMGFQLGTESDERLNSIVGEERGRIIPVLTAYRNVGPHQVGLATAVTWSSSAIGSDFDYVKLQTEMLKRFDFENDSVIFTRLHLGTFLQEKRLSDDPEIDDWDEFSIPRYELFRLGGRDALKGIDSGRGTDELHVTNEYLTPIFRNRDHRVLGARVNDLYGIAYAGAGASVFGPSDLVDLDRWVVDVGVGFEATVQVRHYRFLVTAIYAEPIVLPDHLRGGELRLSARTLR
jgi:hypothetical protein